MTVPLRRLLMTVDAVGGVWRYAMDLASGLQQQGTHVTFACFGPPPSPNQIAEARRIGEIIPVDAPLDWTASNARDLDRVPELIASLACLRENMIDRVPDRLEPVFRATRVRPTQWIASSTSAGPALSLRDPGFGWLHFLVAPGECRHLAADLLRIAESAPPSAQPSDS